ncbi:MAG TPA: PorP/SprF family type IX secretion system membrane protein [Cyclobacteriaceae bacterium]|nr:PorP/SprF family type IX secretion system membrane protein [Cyclobacteriaceae bacterium]
MSRIKILIYIFVCLVPICTYAQDISNFTQFFINPYSINPSYAGIEGRSALSLVYKRQWMDIEGGPAIANLTLHAPTPIGLNYGLSFTNDTRGILSTSAASLTIGYTLTIDKHKFIRFAASGGVAYNGIDIEEFEDTTDPALMNILDKNASLIGNAGISFHLNTVHFGASLPNIFSPAYVSEDAFTVKEVKPFQSVIAHASNRFYFNKDKHVFEPYLIYRINQDLPSQIEAAAVLHLNHVVWFGGSYKQDFGISALGGVKVQNFFLIGGSYSLKNTGANELNSPSFEVQLSYIFGAKKKNIPVYSFVNTVKEKEKPIKKSASQQLAEKRKAEEEKKKQEAAALAKKKEEEAKLQAELEKKQVKEPVKAPVVVAVTPKENPPVTPPAKHDGGPRLKSEVLAIDMPTQQPYDTAHHEEQARISRLTEHAADPDEHHGAATDAHPNAERHEFVKKGSHQEELEVADYVIAGVFKSDANATHFAEGLKKLGFTADSGHLTEKNLWYVYIAQASDINQARAERDKYRKMKIFRDAWLLTVFH